MCHWHVWQQVGRMWMYVVCSQFLGDSIGGFIGWAGFILAYIGILQCHQHLSDHIRSINCIQLCLWIGRQAVNGRNSNWQIPSWRWLWPIPSVPCWRRVVEQSQRAPPWRRRGDAEVDLGRPDKHHQTSQKIKKNMKYHEIS